MGFSFVSNTEHTLRPERSNVKKKDRVTPGVQDVWDILVQTKPEPPGTWADLLTGARGEPIVATAPREG